MMPIYKTHVSGITENYYIIVEQPLCISVTGILAAKWKNQPAASCLKWYQDEYVRLLIHTEALSFVIFFMYYINK